MSETGLELFFCHLQAAREITQIRLRQGQCGPAGPMQSSADQCLPVVVLYCHQGAVVCCWLCCLAPPTEKTEVKLEKEFLYGGVKRN